VPKFKYLKRTTYKEEVDDFARAADAILLDHKTGNRFAGFRNGLEIGKHIASILPDFIPIRYYSAYNDLLRGATDASKREVEEFTRRKNVRVVGKGDLDPERKLKDFCNDLQVHFEARLKELKTMIVKNLQSADLVGRERKLFRIENFDRRRKYQEVRNLEDPYAPTIELSTRALQGLKLDRSVNDIVLEVCEFSSGHVISSFATQPRLVSKDVMKLLQQQHDETE
jgi:hypothetical protein